jgi:MFS family permease
MSRATETSADRGEDRESGDAGVSADGRLTGSGRRMVTLLGLPTLAFALAATVVTTYVPVAAQPLIGSTVVIGAIVGLEGLVALWLPLISGTWSDRLRTPIGGRLPFLLAAAPVLVAGLVMLALAGSTAALAAGVLVFFIGYFIGYEPYRALYPDAVGQQAAGRSQGVQALWRGVGTGLALLGGGLLVAIADGLPFFAAAAVVILCFGAFAQVLHRRGVPDQQRTEPKPVRRVARETLALVTREPALRAFLIANGLWELSLAALKTFVVLYVTQGLGFSRTASAAIIGGVAGVVLVGSLVSGRLADRHGHLRVLRIALPVYGLGFVVPFLVADRAAVAAAIPLVAAGGGAVMALPYAVLMQLMPSDQHGVLTGYFSFSRGLGTWLGPLLAGLAIAALSDVFAETDGYQAVWGVCAAAALLSLLPLRRLSAALT